MRKIPLDSKVQWYDNNNHPMQEPPQMSFVCPIPWDSLKGSAASRYCSACDRMIPNLSLLSRNEREAILEKAESGTVCAAFYRRLSGELVTVEDERKTDLTGKIRQVGVAVVAVSALGFSTGCVSRDKPKPAETPQKVEATVQPEKPKEEETIEFFMGIICPFKPSPKSIGPSGKTR